MTLAAETSPAIAPAPVSTADRSAWPPGFRFHPTDEELVLYYLKRKICRRRLRLNIISELDVYKWDPEELPGQSLLKTGDRQWFFFSPRDRKYPNAARSNRATRQGYWKATGKDRNITSCCRAVGVKKTLVFYKGRAPNGERTDWVMHEYTLDEEELKRCQNARDYYALYKVFKKSGVGPKNGEQYGAPFREEDWAIDDCFDTVKAADQEIPVEQPPVVICNAKAVDAIELNPVNDIEEFFNDLASLQDLDQVLGNDDGFMPLEVGLEEEEELQSTLVDPPPMPGEVVISEPPYSVNTNTVCYDMPQGVDHHQLGSSEWQLPENSVITNTAENCTRTHRSEDFLEIDDLAFGDNGYPNMENIGQQAEYEESNVFGGIEVFHDAVMFLRDIGSVDQGNVSGSYVHSFSNSLRNEDYYGLQPSQFGDVDQSCSQLWDHEQRLNSYTIAEPVQGVQHLPSGSVSDTTNLLNESSQIQGNDGRVAVSRLSSALWAFVESIPTTPASASESTLVNRAFERMSSFSRVRINSAATNSSNGSGSAVVRMGRSRRCFFILYLLGVIGALCGVLIVYLRQWGTSAS